MQYIRFNNKYEITIVLDDNNISNQGNIILSIIKAAIKQGKQTDMNPSSLKQYLNQNIEPKSTKYTVM